MKARIDLGRPAEEPARLEQRLFREFAAEFGGRHLPIGHDIQGEAQRYVDAWLWRNMGEDAPRVVVEYDEGARSLYVRLAGEGE